MLIELPDEWIERPGTFEETLWVHEKTHRDDELLSRAHLSYYADEHTVELAVDGEYTFEYHDTREDAHATVQRLAKEATATLDERGDVAFWDAFTDGGASE